MLELWDVLNSLIIGKVPWSSESVLDCRPQGPAIKPQYVCTRVRSMCHPLICLRKSLAQFIHTWYERGVKANILLHFISMIIFSMNLKCMNCDNETWVWQDFISYFYVDGLGQDCSISIANTGDTAVLHKTINVLTLYLLMHWGFNEMASILQITFLNTR